MCLVALLEMGGLAGLAGLGADGWMLTRMLGETNGEVLAMHWVRSGLVAVGKG